MGQLVRVKTGTVQPASGDFAVRERKEAREGRDPTMMDVDPDSHDLGDELQQVVRNSVEELVWEAEAPCMPFQVVAPLPSGYESAQHTCVGLRATMLFSEIPRRARSRNLIWSRRSAARASRTVCLVLRWPARELMKRMR